MVTVNSLVLKGQDIENVLNADSVAISYWQKLLATDPLVVSGGLSARTVYDVSTSKKKPFSYIFNGDAAVDVFGFNVPLSFSYSSRGIDYQLSSPVKINRIKFDPQYKWVKLHLGQSAMAFSPYTLAGMQFTGIGADLSPKGPIKASIMRGKFFDAIAYNPEEANRLPVYERMGAGFKLSFQKAGTFVETTFLSANDQPNSITLPVDTLIAVAPLQNVSYSFISRLSPLKAVNMNIEYASSAINYDLKNNSRPLDQMLWGDHAGVLRFSAYKLGIDFSPRFIKFGFSMEHIDPDYQTLGAYYSRNDFQNITLNSTLSLFKGKFSVGGNVGMEKDNLKNLKERQNTRLVGAFNTNIQPVKKISIGISYSNFQSFSNIKDQFDYINTNDPYQYRDTLKFSQITQNSTVNFMYSIKQSKTQNQRLAMFFTMNETNSIQTGLTTDMRVNFYNLNSQWSLAKPKSGFNCSASVNSSYNTSSINSVLTVGPSVVARKPFFNKKLELGANVAYNISQTNSVRTNTNFNFRSTTKYAISTGQSISLDLYLLSRVPKDKPKQLNYSISLAYSLKLKEHKFFKPFRKPIVKSDEETDGEEKNQ